MTVQELFQKTSYEELWKEYVKIEGLNEEKYPYDKLGQKKVFEFIKNYDGKKSDKRMVVCIKDYENLLSISGISLDENLPCDLSKLSNEDLWNIETYALECSKIFEWADWEVFEKSLQTYGENICAAYIL